MPEESKSPNVIKMDALIKQCQAEGFDGVRLFVPNNRDISIDDIAHDFCALEAARRAGKMMETATVDF